MRADSPTVAVVGAAVPPELVLAVGMRPVRLSGAPRPTPLADAYGAAELDPPATAAFEQLLEGTYRFALIGSDTLAQTVLFQTLREIQRTEPVEALPRYALVDVLHLPYRTTARYDRGQLTRVLGLLEDWSGERADLSAAIRQTNDARRRLARLRELRTTRPARISGTEVLRFVHSVLTSSDHEVQEREHEGRRVYLTGSAHEDATIYELLEARGYVVVGEDHALGEEALGAEIAEDGEPLDALAEHAHHAYLPARISIAERAAHVAEAATAAGTDVVVCFTYEHDRATPWDAPALQAAVEAAGLPFVSLPTQRLGDLDEEAIAL
jgi:benzoyl-CoA reductase/2-hydroxyglutaryl-CoA dehydratase subunit BcrC/BadD/HgdB